MSNFISRVAGFLGIQLAERQCNAEHHIVDVDELMDGHKDNIFDNIEFCHQD